MIMSLIYYGGTMIGASQITVGGLTSFLFYAVYIGASMTGNMHSKFGHDHSLLAAVRCSWPLNCFSVYFSGLTNFYSELMRGLGASTRLWELMERVPAIPFDTGLVPTSELKGKISFQNVHFAYPARPDNPIFRGKWKNKICVHVSEVHNLFVCARDKSDHLQL